MDYHVFTNKHVVDMLQHCEDMLKPGVIFIYFAQAIGSPFAVQLFAVGEGQLSSSKREAHRTCSGQRLRV